MANKSSSKQGKTTSAQEKNFAGQLLKKRYIHQVMDWGIQHLKTIGIVAGVVVLLLVMVFSWLTYKKSLDEHASTLEGEAFKLHQEAQQAISSQSPSEDSTEEDSEEPQNLYQEASALYQKILDEYSGTKSAERALYMLGSIEFELGNYDQAQEYFSTYRSKYPKGILVSSAEESLAYVFEQKQDYQQALDIFKGLASTVDSSKKIEILLAIARNYESLDQFDDAIASYQTIVDSDTSFSLKNQAKERLDFLQAQQKIASAISEPVEVKQEEIKVETVPETSESIETPTTSEDVQAAEGTPTDSSENQETPTTTEEDSKIDPETPPLNEENTTDEKGTGSN
jgi:tetratricopeptide (TPR) repeat protein